MGRKAETRSRWIQRLLCSSCSLWAHNPQARTSLEWLTQAGYTRVENQIHKRKSNECIELTWTGKPIQQCLNSTQAIISATNKVEKNSAHPWDAEDIKERFLLEKNEGSDSLIFYWKSIEKINNDLLKQPDNQKPQRIETHQTNQVKHLKVWCLVTTKEVDDANPCRAKQSNQALSHLILPSRSSMSSSSFWLVTRTSAASGMVPSSMSTL